jgi:cysteinyl-tRNA synthetase
MINFNSVGLYQNQYSSTANNKVNNSQMFLKKNIVLTDSFESSQKQIRFKESLDKVIRSLDDKFAKPATLEELQELAKQAHVYSRPLENGIYRKDFKGIVSKEKIIEILEAERDKADMQGTKDRFQRLINDVKKLYQS